MAKINPYFLPPGQLHLEMRFIKTTIGKEPWNLLAKKKNYNLLWLSVTGYSDVSTNYVGERQDLELITAQEDSITQKRED